MPTRSGTSILGVASAALILGVTLGARQGAEDLSMFSALPFAAPAPVDNPTTPDRVALGRLLFWDPILSGSGDIACATCHHPSQAYADGRDLPIGTGGQGIGPARRFRGTPPIVKRNSPTVLNAAFNGLVAVGGSADPVTAPMFWDMRARGLEAQALGPIESAEEMRGTRVEAGKGVAAAVERIGRVREYEQLFTKAFGEPDAVNQRNLAKAIAAFERTLITPDSPFDRYMRGDKTAMKATAVVGMAMFRDGGCIGCHKGPMFSDFQPHVLGVNDHPSLREPDTGIDGHDAFRTPSLRNVNLTAPYMHNGRVVYLSEAVGFYQRPGPNLRVPRSEIDPLLNRVNVRAALWEVIDFLMALEGTFDRTVPKRVPSGLKPGGQ